MEDEDQRCTCSDGIISEEHSCPYQADIHNNDEPHCLCCSFCERQCAMDI